MTPAARRAMARLHLAAAILVAIGAALLMWTWLAD
jgi:hypothetical protein